MGDCSAMSEEKDNWPMLMYMGKPVETMTREELIEALRKMQQLQEADADRYRNRFEYLWSLIK